MGNLLLTNRGINLALLGSILLMVVTVRALNLVQSMEI